MKTLKKVIALAVILLLMAGCTMKENLTMTISTDKNIKVSVLMAMDNEMIDGMLSMGNTSGEKKTYTDADRWAYLEGDSSTLSVPKDYKTEKYDKDNFKGYVATKDFGKIDAVSAESATARVNILGNSKDSSNDSDDIFKGTLFIKNGNKYKSNMTIDMGDSSSQLSTYQASGAIFDLKLIQPNH